jgi:hypothetical protein
MKDHDPKRPATGARTLVEPRRLLAALSLLGASLGVSAAAPPDSISGSERGLRSTDAAVRLAETKTPDSPGSNSSFSWGLNAQSKQFASNQKKGARTSKSMGWDVRSSQSNQKKESGQSNQKKETLSQSNQWKIRSDQKKLPAVQ